MTLEHANEAKTTVQGQTYTYWADFIKCGMYAQNEAGEIRKIKGSGCIRTREHFLRLIDMGIDRMGVGYRSVPVVLDLNK